MTAPIHVEHVFFLPGTAREEAWSLLADTDQLNRLIGFPAIAAQIVGARKGDTRVRVAMRAFPGLAWEESPWDFVRPLKYRVKRTYFGGPIASFDGGAELVEDPAGTRVRLFSTFVPRFSILAGLVRAAAAREMRKTSSRLTAALARSRETGSPVFAPPPTPLAYGAEQRLSAAAPALAAVSPHWAPKLLALLRSGPDVAVIRIRPFELADAWGAPRLEILRLCLHAAARHSLLELRWDITCPHCRVPGVRGKALTEIREDSRCPACELSYDIGLETAVEVSFSVHFTVRAIEPVQFCIGAPAKRRGLLAQALLAPKETRRMTIPLPAGDWLLTRADVIDALEITAGAGAGSVKARIGDKPVAEGGGSRVEVAAGEVEIEISNDLDDVVRVGLTAANVSDDSASAAVVTSLQEFRDLFSREVLADGVQMDLSSMTLLFTDLKGSTKMYETFKDGPVFERVRKHFDALTEAVAAEGGCVVKTIGDAVMAAFRTPAAGVRAALAMQRRIDALNGSLASPPFLTVKVGLHTGPCLAITANERLDYFGNTVNTAARIEGQSHGGDVVITDAVASDAEVAALLKSLPTSGFEAELKGLSGVQKLVRIEVRATSRPAAMSG